MVAGVRTFFTSEGLAQAVKYWILGFIGLSNTALYWQLRHRIFGFKHSKVYRTILVFLPLPALGFGSFSKDRIEFHRIGYITDSDYQKKEKLTDIGPAFQDIDKILRLSWICG